MAPTTGSGTPFIRSDSMKVMKPLLRGVSHLLASGVALIAGLYLHSATRTPRASLAVIIYTLSMVLLFGVSGTYHVFTWSPRVRQVLKKMDHASIFILIAGTYTPLCMLALDEGSGAAAGTGSFVLTMVWTGALAGVLQTLFWSRGPRLVRVVFYLALGWAIVPYAKEVYEELGARGGSLMLGGGVLYSIGALVYSMKWPNPWPSVYGYHELFHIFVIAAASCHFKAILDFIQSGRK